jgi:hypothetical protein
MSSREGVRREGASAPEIGAVAGALAVLQILMGGKKRLGEDSRYAATPKRLATNSATQSPLLASGHFSQENRLKSRPKQIRLASVKRIVSIESPPL